MRLLCLLMMFSVALAACSQSHTEDSAADGRQTSEQKIVVSVDEVLSRGSGGPVELLLIPSAPSSIEDVRGRVVGCSESMVMNWSVNGKVLVENSSSISAENYSRGDLLGFHVRCGSQRVKHEVRIENTPPVINQLGFAGETVVSGQELALVAQSFDDDGDEVEVTYRWFIDGEELLGNSTGVLPAEFVSAGREISVSATPSDGYGSGLEFSGDSFIVPNSPPRFVSSPLTNFTAAEYRYEVQVVDPDQDNLTYRLEEAPAGMTIDPVTGLIVWPIDNSITGEVLIRVVVEDTAGNYASQEFTLNLTLKES